MAGPWADEGGAMIIFDVSDMTTLNDVLAADPYFTTSGVRVTATREWRPFLS